MSRVAMCYEHDEPLVASMIVAKYEFLCLKCGRLYGYLDPRPAPETPELMALADERRAEFEALVQGIIVDRSWLESCEKCKRTGAGEYHSQHATDEERAADRAARERIIERVPALAGRL